MVPRVDQIPQDPSAEIAGGASEKDGARRGCRPAGSSKPAGASIAGRYAPWDSGVQGTIKVFYTL